MRKNIYLISMIIFFKSNLIAQTNDSKEFLYNISLGALFGGIGAIINKKHEQKFDKILIKGVAQGALGGYITFESKRLLRLAKKNEDWKLIWSAKLVNAAGTSIKENAALNENFWNKWHINFGFNRIEFLTKNNFKVKYRIQPIAFVYTLDAFFRYDKFELENSLKTGEFMFSSSNISSVRGATLAGYFVANSNFKNDYSLITHEIIHIYQSNDFSTINVYLDKPINYLNSKSVFFNSVNNYIYYDLHYIPLSMIYNLEKNNSINYYDNFLEREAGYYSGTLRK